MLTVQFQYASYNATRGEQVVITAVLSSIADREVTVQFITSDNSAQGMYLTLCKKMLLHVAFSPLASIDYTNASETLLFPAGNDTASVSVNITKSENIIEQSIPVNFEAFLSNATNGLIIHEAEDTVTINICTYVGDQI